MAEFGTKIYREDVLILLGIDKGKWRFNDIIEETGITDVNLLADIIDFLVSKKIFSKTKDDENPKNWILRNDYKKIDFNISSIPSRNEDMRIYEGVEFNKNHHTIYATIINKERSIFEINMFDIQGRMISKFELIQSHFDDFIYTSTFEWWKLNSDSDGKNIPEAQKEVDKNTTVILKRMREGDDLLFLCINGMTHFKIFMKKEDNTIFSYALWWCCSKTIIKIPVSNNDILFDNKKQKKHENGHGYENRNGRHNTGFSRGYSRDESSERVYHKRSHHNENRKSGGSHPYKKFNEKK